MIRESLTVKNRLLYDLAQTADNYHSVQTTPVLMPQAHTGKTCMENHLTLIGQFALEISRVIV